MIAKCWLTEKNIIVLDLETSDALSNYADLCFFVKGSKLIHKTANHIKGTQRITKFNFNYSQNKDIENRGVFHTYV